MKLKQSTYRRFKKLVPFVALLCVLAGPSALAGILPAYIDFDADTAGSAPSTGGIDEPTFFLGDVIVRDTANGIATKPVVVTVDANNLWYGFGYSFVAVSSGVLRYEATVSFDRLASGFFAQTKSSNGAVVTRLTMLKDGVIQTYDGSTILGYYIPGTPFRMRMDVDMSGKTYAMTIDAEMDGFENDPRFSDLAFVNDPSSINDIDEIQAGSITFSSVSDNDASLSTAFDDVHVFKPGQGGSPQRSALVVSNHTCIIPDGNIFSGETWDWVVNQDGHLSQTFSQNGNATLVCQFEEVSNNIKSALVYGHDELFEELQVEYPCTSDIAVPALSTFDWKIVVSPSGKATLTCHFGD